MKKWIGISLLLTVALASNAQQGFVIYEQRTNLHKGLPEIMKKRVPEFQTIRFSLSYVDSISLFKSLANEDAPDPFEANSSARTATAGGGSENLHIYNNHGSGATTEQRELYTRPYLIKDHHEPLTWKLGSETKTIHGYLCRKATTTIQLAPTSGWTFKTTTKDTTNAPSQAIVVAWYTEQVKVPAGPMDYNGLPGLILEVDIDNGTIAYSVVEIKKNAKDIKEPGKGKVVSRKEFESIRKQLAGKRVRM